MPCPLPHPTLHLTQQATHTCVHLTHTTCHPWQSGTVAKVVVGDPAPDLPIQRPRQEAGKRAIDRTR